MLPSDEFAQLVVLLLADGAVGEGGAQAFLPLGDGLLLLLQVVLAQLRAQGLHLVLHLEDLHVLGLALAAHLLQLRRELTHALPLLLPLRLQAPR